MIRLRKLAVIYCLLLFVAACDHRVNPLTIERPNARTTLEERSYNLLTTSETLLDAADTCRASVDCEIATFMVPVLNALVKAHNAGRLVALEYAEFLDAGGTKAIPVDRAGRPMFDEEVNSLSIDERIALAEEINNADADLGARLAGLIVDLDGIIRQVVTGGGAQ